MDRWCDRRDATGGGGIPVTMNGAGNPRGVEAVIDKDLAGELLARRLDAELPADARPTVARGHARLRHADEGAPIDRMTLSEAKQYLAEGMQFAERVSMAPKIAAA